jgi:hypothetical protein
MYSEKIGGFRGGKGTGDAVWMLRIISEQTLEIDLLHRVAEGD